MSRRPAALALLVVAPLLALGLTGGVEAAVAATGSAPVTAPDDAGSTYPGNVAFADPLSNDTDPDQDELALCRVGTERYRGVQAAWDGYDFAIFAGQRAKPGTYAFTYYACDFSYLTAGTVSVTVEAPPAIELVAVPGRPGRVRVENPADFAVRVLYGSFREDGPDGTVLVRAGGSKVVRVTRDRVDWIAYDRTGQVFVTRGRVRDVRLPRGGAVDRPGPAPRGFAWGATR